MRAGARERGFSLLEVMVALALLSVIGMTLMSMLVSSQQLTSVTRERAIAMNAIRAYVESMRSKNLAAFRSDTTTPINFLPSTRALKDPQAEVYKLDYESGNSGRRVLGAFTVVSGVEQATSTVTLNYGATAAGLDATALAFTTGGRDLDGDGAMTGAPISDPSKLVVMPARIVMTWATGAGKGRQRMVVHVCLGQ